MNLPKPNKINAEKYVAGLSLYKRKAVKIKLSANESALGPSPKAIKEYNKESKNLKRYPDSEGRLLRKVLANKFKLDPKRIILGSGSDQIFVYIKGPTQAQGGGNFYIDDFSLVPQGSPPVNFNDISDIVDIGAYEFTSTLSLDDSNSSITKVVKVYPNPATNEITLSEKFGKNQLTLFDLLGKNYPIKLMDNFNSSTNIDISSLSSGLYFIKIITNNSIKSIKFFKE